MVAYDMDGVIAPALSWLKWIYKTIPKLAVWIRHFYKPKMRPIEPYYFIITNRPEKDRRQTERWLYKHNIQPIEVIYSKGKNYPPFDPEHKAYYINKLRVTKFYEDHSELAKALEEKCPDAEIVKVCP